MSKPTQKLKDELIKEMDAMVAVDGTGVIKDIIEKNLGRKLKKDDMNVSLSVASLLSKLVIEAERFKPQLTFSQVITGMGKVMVDLMKIEKTL